MKHELLRLDNVMLRREGVTLLRNATITLYRGEITGLLNLSSPGLSQFIDVIHKNIPISAGRVYFNRKLVNSCTGTRRGPNPVFIVDENPRLCANLTIAENFCFFQRGGCPVYRQARVKSAVEHFFSEFGLSLSADMPVSSLRPYERSLVELIFAQVHGAELLILYNPESYLGDHEIKRLLRFIQALAARNASVLYVSNHFTNLASVCRRVALMNNGAIVKIFCEDELGTADLTPYLSPIQAGRHRISADPDTRPLLIFNNIHTENLTGFTCTIPQNRCTVLVDEFGKSAGDVIELMTAGLASLTGSIRMGDLLLKNDRGSSLVRNQIAVIPYNPTKTNLCYDMSYLDNLCLLFDLRRRAVITRTDIQQSIILEYRKHLGDDMLRKNLYGMTVFSLYRLVYYRIKLLRPQLVLIDRAFAGCDIATHSHIQSLIQMLLGDGITVVLFEPSAKDITDLADKILTFADGAVSDQPPVSETR